jgi:hypothetical protein
VAAKRRRVMKQVAKMSQEKRCRAPRGLTLVDNKASKQAMNDEWDDTVILLVLSITNNKIGKKN